jgi:TnpA family transposase
VLLDPARLWEALERVCPREQFTAALAEVERLTGDVDDPTGEEAWRSELLSRFGTVRPFLSLLSEVIPFGATAAGQPILDALKALPALRKRQRVRPNEIAAELVTGGWRRLVLANPDLPADTVDHRAYIFCVLEHVHRALRRRDMFARVSLRWADPRQQLLDGERWTAVRAKVLAGLDLAAPVAEHLAGLAAALDAAHRDTATRIAVSIDQAADAGVEPVVSVVTDRDGKPRLRTKRLEPVGEPRELAELREMVAAMLPRVDLPEVLLEVHSWTGFLSAFTHVTEQVTGNDTGADTRMADVELSVAACLVAEGCNLGFAPVVKPGNPAFSRDRLSHVDQNYLRAETLSAANARLITAQADIGIARLWGGGLVASVDGLRFVVPVQTINAGPNPKYFGLRRGVTWLNAVSDQVAGLGAVLVPGTVRDSLYVLDCLLNLDGGARPEMVTSDTASYSDIVFGLFRLLGYQFSPRIADLADQRLWRIDRAARYGPLDPLSARNVINTERVTAHWEDMLRVAGSLVTGAVRAYDLLRMPGREGHPTPLGAAIADYGRIAKTLHLLAVLDPDDETYRRTINTQLTVQESRHRLARKLFYGQRGELRQRYREGQEDQLSALGLVLNAVVLWNTRYTDAAIHELRVQGHDVPDEYAARLSPLVDSHLNVHGRYTFTTSGLPAAGLRPLRDPAEPVDDDWQGKVLGFGRAGDEAVHSSSSGSRRRGRGGSGRIAGAGRTRPP